MMLMWKLLSRGHPGNIHPAKLGAQLQGNHVLIEAVDKGVPCGSCAGSQVLIKEKFECPGHFQVTSFIEVWQDAIISCSLFTPKWTIPWWNNYRRLFLFEIFCSNRQIDRDEKINSVHRGNKNNKDLFSIWWAYIFLYFALTSTELEFPLRHSLIIMQFK